MHYKLPLIFEPQPEGGYTVGPLLVPEPWTEGDAVEDTMENLRDEVAAVLGINRDSGRSLPSLLSMAS